MSGRIWDYYGNEWAPEMLCGQIQKGQLKQSYLFTGPDSVGKRTLALKFAKAILCPNSKKGEPCGVCPTCTKVDLGQGFDLKLIQRLGGKADILIEQVREAEAFLRITPFAASKKIVIITDFELANANSQNALLKTLEEAPAYALILLLSQDQQMLLPTVVSRCEKVELRPSKTETIENFLVTLNVAEDKKQLFAHISGGCPGLAWKLANDGEALLQERNEVLNSLFDVLYMPLCERFNFAETIQLKDRKAREQAKIKSTTAKKGKIIEFDIPESDDEVFEEGLAERWLLTWMNLFGDIVYAANGVTNKLVNIDHTQKIEETAKKVGTQLAIDCYKASEKALYQLRVNGNKRMVFETLFLTLPELKGSN